MDSIKSIEADRTETLARHLTTFQAGKVSEAVYLTRVAGTNAAHDRLLAELAMERAARKAARDRKAARKVQAETVQAETVQAETVQTETLTTETATAYVLKTFAGWGYEIADITAEASPDGEAMIDVSFSYEHATDDASTGMMSVWVQPDGNLYGEW